MRGIVLFALLLATTLSAATQEVKLRLQWKHQFEFAGFYMAKELGYYKDAGMEVQILEYEQDVDLIGEVESQKVEFGVRGSDLVKEWMNGRDIVMLANYFKRSPLAIVTKPEIRLPTDLKGKKLMISAADVHNPTYMQMFETFGLDMDDLQIVPPSFDINDFIEGKVDAYSVFLTNEPFTLQKKGVRYNVLDPSNYGVELYNANLYTSKALVKNDPVTVQKFVEASNRGWEYALKHPEEAVEVILKKYNTQNKSKEALLFEAKETAKVMLSKTYPVGSIDPKRIKQIGSLFAEMDLAPPRSEYDSFIFGQQGAQVHLSKQERRYILQNPVATVSMMDDFVPFSFREEGKEQGYVADLLELLSEKTGIAFQKRSGSWSEIFDDFKNGRTDMIADISYKEYREPYTLFSKAYYELPVLIFVRDGFQAYSGLQSLKGKRVGIQKDIFYEEDLRNVGGMELVEFESVDKLAKSLSFGRIDAVIQNLSVMNYYIKKNGLANVRAIDELRLPGVGREDLRLGVTPQKPILYSIVQKGLDAISKQEYQTLANIWIGTGCRGSGERNWP